MKHRDKWATWAREGDRVAHWTGKTSDHGPDATRQAEALDAVADMATATALDTPDRYDRADQRHQARELAAAADRLRARAETVREKGRP